MGIDPGFGSSPFGIVVVQFTPILAINPKFEKLTTSLRTAISDDLGKLDKEATSYDNVLDAFRLSLQMFKLKEKERDTVLFATIEIKLYMLTRQNLMKLR
jgi:hypothetical protein